MEYLKSIYEYKKSVPKYGGGINLSNGVGAANMIMPFVEKATTKNQTDMYGVKHQQKDVGVSALSGAATGAGYGTMIAPGIGTAIGTGLGFVLGGATAAIGNNESANAIEESKQAYASNMTNFAVNKQKNLVAQGFNSQGKQGSIYKKGGVIPKYGDGKNLNEGQIIAYNNWLKTNNIQETADYDMKGYWQNEGFKQLKHEGHFSDTYKKADFTPFSNNGGDNYELLSDESKYASKFDKRGQGYWNDKDQMVAYKKGGNLIKPQYLVEGAGKNNDGEVVIGDNVQLDNQQDLASNMTLATGDSHDAKSGGTKGKNGDFVVTGRNEIGEDLVGLLKQYKYNFKPTDSSALVAQKLGKDKGKFEKNLDSKDALTVKTANVMLERIEGLSKANNENQEAQKGIEEQGMKTYAKTGGNLMKYGGGSPIVGSINPATQKPFTVQEIELYNSMPQTNKFGTEYVGAGNTVDGITERNFQTIPEANLGVTPVEPLQTWTRSNNQPPSWKPLVTNPKYGAVVGEGATNQINPPVVSTPDTKSNSTNNNSNTGIPIEQLLNAGVTATNYLNADKQGTHIKRQTATPNYIKTPNNLGFEKQNINSEISSDKKDIIRKSGNINDTSARLANLTAAGLEATNKAVVNQNNVELQTNNMNTSIGNDYRNRVAENINADKIDELQGKNAILTNKQNALNTGLAGFIHNKTTQEAYDVEKQKLAIARMDGGRGTADRSTASIRKMVESGSLSPSDFERMTGEKYSVKKGGYIKKAGKAYC